MEDDLKVNALERPYGPEREEIPLRWEPEHVGRRLVKAFVTFDRLPEVRGPREPGGHWPLHAVELADQLARAELDQDERRARDIGQNRTVLQPTSIEIAQMEMAFDWLRGPSAQSPADDLQSFTPNMTRIDNFVCAWNVPPRSSRAGAVYVSLAFRCYAGPITKRRKYM